MKVWFRILENSLTTNFSKDLLTEVFIPQQTLEQEQTLTGGMRQGHPLIVESRSSAPRLGCAKTSASSFHLQPPAKSGIPKERMAFRTNPS